MSIQKSDKQSYVLTKGSEGFVDFVLNSPENDLEEIKNDDFANQVLTRVLEGDSSLRLNRFSYLMQAASIIGIAMFLGILLGKQAVSVNTSSNTIKEKTQLEVFKSDHHLGTITGEDFLIIKMD